MLQGWFNLTRLLVNSLEHTLLFLDGLHKGHKGQEQIGVKA